MLLPLNMARSRRCSDDAELRLPITIIQHKFLGLHENLLLDNETWRSKEKKGWRFMATAGLLDVAGRLFNPNKAYIYIIT